MVSGTLVLPYPQASHIARKQEITLFNTDDEYRIHACVNTF